MKVLVALTVVALAAADSDSFYPGGFPFARHAGFPFAGMPRHHPFQMQQHQQLPYNFQHQQFPFVPYQQHQRLFRRDAESDSDSFYPGFPYMPPSPYMHQYGQYQQTPYFHHQAASPYMHHRGLPMPFPQQQFTTYSHPMAYNPLLKFAEVKNEEVKEHKLEKRESESESFYPGFPYMPPSPYYGQYHHQPYAAQPFAAQPFAGQSYGLPSVVPRVLPYNFPGMYNGYHQSPMVRTFKPVVEEKKVVE